MPELPEVEGVRRTLEAAIVGCRFARVRVLRRDVVVGPGDPFGGWSRAGEAARASAMTPGGGRRRVTGAMLLAGDRVRAIHRRGKALAIEGEAGRAVVVHLGMTGQLRHAAARARLDPADHVHVAWWLADARGRPEGRLVFRDPRRFGGVWIARDMAEVRGRHWAGLGVDGLAAEEQLRAALTRALERTERAVKAVLLDQRVIAGVGNIYADEALFDAGIAPDLPGRCVDAAAAGALARAVRGVLTAAVEAGGTTLRDYVDAYGRAGGFQGHAAYGRAGEPCARCGCTLERRVIAQRGTVACPDCQGWATAGLTAR